MGEWKHPMWKMSDGKSVMQFCKETGTIYNTVLKNIRRGFSVDEACQIAYRRKNKKDSATKFWVGDKSLYKYCIENSLSYGKMLKTYREINNEKLRKPQI